MKRKNLIFVLLPFLMISCEDMVSTVDVPQSGSHYVLHAYLSPEDSLVTVVAGKSKPVFGDQTTDTSWVSQSHVLVNGFELSRVPGSDYRYTAPAASFPVIPGEFYTVELKVGTETVCSGSCTVPAWRNESMTFDGVDSVAYQSYEGTIYYDYYILYSFTDLASEENFYRIVAEVTYVDPYSGDTSVYTTYPESSLFIKDVLFNGDQYSERIFLGGTEAVSGLAGLRLMLYTSDRDYYFYHRAIVSQDGDDPFSEPVTVPSNVDNGLGCIAGVRKYTVIVF
ncbi:MAG: DUF4249 domain-containing protein [Bacteroidales bacterium]|jgi:hypothetical protein|nr:DUF4249 domain-containing protein [Bacteroidales bacterium]